MPAARRTWAEYVAAERARRAKERAQRDALLAAEADRLVEHVRALGGSIERAYLAQQPWPGVRLAIRQGRLFRCGPFLRLDQPLTA